jgi:two-component system response regulator BaeR
VLIVDDDPLTLEVLRERLESAGFEATVRDRSIGTSDVVAAEAPDFVLLDLHMPGLGGEQLGQLLQRHERTRETQIILHSSRPRDELDRIVGSMGVLGAIEKTADDERFLAQFLRLVRRGRRPAQF